MKLILKTKRDLWKRIDEIEQVCEEYLAEIEMGYYIPEESEQEIKIVVERILKVLKNGFDESEED